MYTTRGSDGSTASSPKVPLVWRVVSCNLFGDVGGHPQAGYLYGPIALRREPVAQNHLEDDVVNGPERAQLGQLAAHLGDVLARDLNPTRLAPRQLTTGGDTHASETVRDAVADGLGVDFQPGRSVSLTRHCGSTVLQMCTMRAFSPSDTSSTLQWVSVI